MWVVLTIIGLVLLYDVLWWRAADRFLRPLPNRWRWRAPLWLFMGAQMLCLLWIVFGRMLGGRPELDLPGWLMVVTFIWHLLVLPATVLAWLAVSTGRGIGAILRKLGPAIATAPQPVEPAPAPAMSRRQLLGAAVAAAPPLVTGVGSVLAVPQLSRFRVRSMTVTLPQLPPALDGLTIAHVTDIHVGRFTEGRVLSKIVEATNDLRADLVLLTGDLINMNVSDLPAALDAVKRMEGRYGVYMCEGNHDLIENGREFRRVTKASGVPLLVNETLDLPVRGVNVKLLGMRWGSGRPGAGRAADRSDGAIRASLDGLLPPVRQDPESFPILLAHHPHAFDPAAEAGIPLTLSGHTHGGQLMLNEHIGFGPMMFRYWTGQYRKADSRLVVSNGVGNWFPLRVAAPAEIVHLTLRRG